jgi:nicotinate-nucleotide pyrophosphorylase (carboxylating)
MLSHPTTEQLLAAGLDPAAVEQIVQNALDEDLRYGPDVTSAATTPAGAEAVGAVVARRPGVLAGLPVALAVLDLAVPDWAGPDPAVPDRAGPDLAVPDRAGLDPGGPTPGGLAPGGLATESVTLLRADGDWIGPGSEVLRIQGPLRELLGAERTLLNFLTHLSGVATATRAWADALAGTGCVVRDTRKTLPGLRALEKYAVRCGGGQNHRMGLGDAALIKDNHVIAAGSITKAIEAVRAAAPGLPLEVECDTLAQVCEALDAGATLILLDNMSPAGLRRAVTLTTGYPGVKLEASGGLSLADAREVAATGVDYVSVGALTHSAPALDLGLDLAPRG